jgi:hypothetical protein
MRKSSIIYRMATLIVASSTLTWGNDLTDPTINVALQWNDVAVTAIKSTSTPPTVAARALAIVHTAMYDAWAAYDTKAIDSLPGSPSRQAQSANTLLNKAAAVSYAAYRTLVDLYPAQGAAFLTKMIELGYDPAITTTTPSTAPGVGNAAAATLLAFRHGDGSNQLGDLGGAAYSDYTGYQAVNFPDDLTDPNHWQPVRAADGSVQRYLSPHWGKVTPFALKSADQFRPGPQEQAGTWLDQQRMRDAIRLQAELDDRGKMCAEYWDDGANTETPPGHWNRLAEEISNRDQHDLDQDVKMFFALNNALFDVSVAVWDAKRTYDAIRPQSAIRFFYKGQTIQGFAGRGKGITSIDGGDWQSWITTAPHPDYPSGHSAFSSASAEILKRFTGSDAFVKKMTFAAGSSRIDPGSSPAKETTMEFFTFSEIADDAGFSRRAGGIHYDEDDYRSRTIGRQVAGVVWDRYLQLTNGAQ